MERMERKINNIFSDEFKEPFDIKKEASFDFNRTRLEMLANQIKNSYRPSTKIYNI